MIYCYRKHIHVGLKNTVSIGLYNLVPILTQIIWDDIPVNMITWIGWILQGQTQIEPNTCEM